MGTQTSVTFRRQMEELPAKEEILHLANFCNQHANAVSFCFSRTASPDNAHREEATTVRKLVCRAIKEFGPVAAPDSFLSDMDGVLAVAEEIRSSASGLHVVYACAEQNIWLQYHIPVRKQLSFLRVGRRFHLAPLMQALQSAAPYCVAILESGKARAFIIRGSEIEELPGKLQVEDLRLHAEDSRVGWSHHIAGSQAEHERAYFRKLSHQLRDLMAEHHIRQWIVGCREELWGEIGPQFPELAQDALMGRFHLSSFDVTAPEVLRAAVPVFAAYQRDRVTAVLREAIETPSHGIFGITEVLEALRAGRVRTLVLENRAERTVSECKTCGQVTATIPKNCAFCEGVEFCAIAAEEALLRAALRENAEILFVEDDSAPGFIGPAALLRY